MFDDAHCYACVTIKTCLVPHYTSFDCRAHTLRWTMRESDDHADRRRKFHSAGRTQVQSGGTDIFEQAIKTKRMIIDVNTPHTRIQRSCRTRFGPTIEKCRRGRKRGFRQWKMRIENVVRSLFTQHKFIASAEFGISTPGL